MVTIFSGIFLIMHSVVIYLYAGQSGRLFELKPGMTWPVGSRAFSKIFGYKTTRKIGLISCLLSGTGLIAGGVALLFDASLWRQIVLLSLAFSSVIIIILWDGTLKKLSDQRFIGLIINLGILVVLLFL